MKNSRRSFLRKIATGVAAASTGSILYANNNSITNSFQILKQRDLFAANDKIQIGLIGAGGMGTADTNTALQIPGVKLLAVSDLYEGRIQQAKEKWGNDIFTTRSYKELLAREDIDAVIVATPDHWHKQISIDAMKAGKAVYCEKPMVHSIDEGPEVIKAQQETKKVFQVGSQGMASLGNEKAKELLAAGAIGDLVFAEGFWARHSPIGAWQYPIPDDASEETVDWETFLGNTKKIPFDSTRFFRWRNYRDYGTGMCGDLFVHLFSSLHFITNSMGPNKIVSTGGLRYWKDGREVPDVLIGMFDYPETKQQDPFNLSLRCNFVDGTSGTTYLKLVGTEGAMDVQWNDVILKRNKVTSSNDPFLKEKTGGQLVDDNRRMLPPEEMKYSAAKGYKGAHYDHFNNFFNSIRTGDAVMENPVFGYRAAAPALLCNDSYFENKIINWDPEKMKLI